MLVNLHDKARDLGELWLNDFYLCFFLEKNLSKIRQLKAYREGSDFLLEKAPFF